MIFGLDLERWLMALAAFVFTAVYCYIMALAIRTWKQQRNLAAVHEVLSKLLKSSNESKALPDDRASSRIRRGGVTIEELNHAHCWHPASLLLTDPPQKVYFCCWCSMNKVEVEHGSTSGHGPRKSFDQGDER